MHDDKPRTLAVAFPGSSDFAYETKRRELFLVVDTDDATTTILTWEEDGRTVSFTSRQEKEDPHE